MPYFEFLWDVETLEHLADHDVSQEDFEFRSQNKTSHQLTDCSAKSAKHEVLLGAHCVQHPDQIDESRSSGRPCCWGTLDGGRRLFCVYEKIDSLTIYPVTAYEIGEDR